MTLLSPGGSASSAAGAKPGLGYPDPKPVPKPGPNGASQSQLEDWSREILGMVTLLIGLWLTNWNEEQAVYLALSPDEADAIAEPLARVIARSGLNKTYGQQLLASSDYAKLAFALASYGGRVAPVMKAKVHGYVEPARTPQRVQPQAGGDPASNGHQRPIPTGAAWSAYQP